MPRSGAGNHITDNAQIKNVRQRHHQNGVPPTRLRFGSDNVYFLIRGGCVYKMHVIRSMHFRICNSLIEISVPKAGPLYLIILVGQINVAAKNSSCEI